jgi:hypothetical protein
MNVLSFVRKKLPKPVHREMVKLVGHWISCSCGTPWFAATLATNEEGRSMRTKLEDHRCPDCGSPPTSNTTSAPEGMDYAVPLRFGQLYEYVADRVSRGLGRVFRG